MHTVEALSRPCYCLSLIQPRAEKHKRSSSSRMRKGGKTLLGLSAVGPSSSGSWLRKSTRISFLLFERELMKVTNGPVGAAVLGPASSFNT